MVKEWSNNGQTMVIQWSYKGDTVVINDQAMVISASGFASSFHLAKTNLAVTGHTIFFIV